MTQRFIDKINKKFVYILSKADDVAQKRKDLIKVAQTEFSLTYSQASGLINRNVHILRKFGAVSPQGDRNDRIYVFSSELIYDAQSSIKAPEENMLASEKNTIETELKCTHYELEAYKELFSKFPQRKNEILSLYNKAREKNFQLKGKLRAITRLISLQ